MLPLLGQARLTNESRHVTTFTVHDARKVSRAKSTWPLSGCGGDDRAAYPVVGGPTRTEKKRDDTRGRQNTGQRREPLIGGGTDAAAFEATIAKMAA